MLRTLPGAIEELKKADPDCALTLTALRRAAKSGALPTVSIGVKRLVDMGMLEVFLRGNVPEQTQTGTGIRRIGNATK